MLFRFLLMSPLPFPAKNQCLGFVPMSASILLKISFDHFEFWGSTLRVLLTNSTFEIESLIYLILFLSSPPSASISRTI